jgi:hypothetical protein
MASSFHMGICTNMALYILEQRSSWSTLRIRPSWPRSRVRLSLLLVLLSRVYSCLLLPTQHLAVHSNGSYFALNPFPAYWRPNTSVQVNNTTMLQCYIIYTWTHIFTSHQYYYSFSSLHFFHSFWQACCP